MPNHPNKAAVDDKGAYSKSLRDQRCVICGRFGDDRESVVGVHIGTHGKGIKTADEQLPICDSHHKRMHQEGEIRVLREIAPDWLIREALRAYARQIYAAREKPKGWAEELVG